MFWQELRDALAKQTGWKSAVMLYNELQIIWEYSNDNTRDGYRLIVYYLSFEGNEKIHTIIITRNNHNLSTSTTRKFKIQETSQNDIDMLVATIKKKLLSKKLILFQHSLHNSEKGGFSL